uniref:Putative secreted protein n=1 Tax=Ixodes scapularis TaxID=6945 RepID=A0A4D5RFI1_IXOSC
MTRRILVGLLPTTSLFSTASRGVKASASLTNSPAGKSLKKLLKRRVSFLVPRIMMSNKQLSHGWPIQRRDWTKQPKKLVCLCHQARLPSMSSASR